MRVSSFYCPRMAEFIEQHWDSTGKIKQASFPYRWRRGMVHIHRSICPCKLSLLHPKNRGTPPLLCFLRSIASWMLSCTTQHVTSIFAVSLIRGCNAVGCRPEYTHLLSTHSDNTFHNLLNLQVVTSFNRSPGSVPSSSSRRPCFPSVG